MKYIRLTREERIIEKEIERGEWIPVPDMEMEIAKYRQIASNTLRKKDKKTK